MSAQLKAVTGLDQFAPDIDMEVDAGIRRAVLILRSQGIETMESCEGGPGHAFPDPTIKFHGSTWAGYRAFAIAMEHGLPVLHLRYTYGVDGGQLSAPCWEMTFAASVRSEP